MSSVATTTPAPATTTPARAPASTTSAPAPSTTAPTSRAESSSVPSSTSVSPTTTAPVSTSTTQPASSSSAVSPPVTTSAVSSSTAPTSQPVSEPVSQPVSTSQAASAPISTTQPASTSAAAVSTTQPSSTTSQVESTSSTTEPLSSTSGFSSTVEVESSSGTLYSTTIVYVSVTDGRGSVGVSQTAIAGGSSNLNRSGGGTNIGAIVGGVVGGVVGAALLGALAFFLWRRKRRTAPDALDEKMFDPSRMARHSQGPVDLLDAGPAGNQISPFTASGRGGPGGAGLAATGGALPAGAGAAGATAYGHNRNESDYGRTTGGSFDSSAYGGGSEGYFMNNMAGAGAGGAGGGPGTSSSLTPGAPVGYFNGNQDYDYAPQSSNRLSGGYGIAAGFGGGAAAGGYMARDYAGRPNEGEGYYQSGSENFADEQQPRMSASAMAKLREARGPTSNPLAAPAAGSTPGPNGFARSTSSYGFASSQGHEGYPTEEDQARRRSSAALSRTSENESIGGYRGGLMVHNDGGPVPQLEEEEETDLPAELPPTYNSVPQGSSK